MSGLQRPGVLTAGLPGTGPTSDDRILVTPDAVVVLDGVTAAPGNHLAPVLYTEALGSHLAQRVRQLPRMDLRDVLAGAIKETADACGLVPGRSPASTVTILRWGSNGTEALLLGDSPVIVFGADGGVETVRDGRHDNLIAELRRRQREAGLDEGSIEQVQRIIRATRAAKRSQMNRPGGYWIAEAEPEAARHAIIRTWRAGTVTAALAVTDGVSCGVEQYGIPPSWPEALHLAIDKGLDTLLMTIHAAEASDPLGVRWPRPKVHDDKAAALVVFTESTAHDRSAR